jgi:hypothetical protein
MKLSPEKGSRFPKTAGIIWLLIVGAIVALYLLNPPEEKKEAPPAAVRP